MNTTSMFCLFYIDLKKISLQKSNQGLKIQQKQYFGRINVLIMQSGVCYIE